MKHQYETKSALFADDDDKSGGNGDENFNDKWRTAGNSGAADCESYDNNTSDYLAACEKYDVQSVRCIGCPAGSYLNHCQQCV